jgi:hypothetical protein
MSARTLVREEKRKWMTVRVDEDTIENLEKIRKKEGLRSIAATIQQLARENA